MSFTLNLPVNSVSFGQVSTLLLRELYKKNLNNFTLYPIGDRYDLSTQESDEGFFNFIQTRTSDFISKIKRTDPVFKLWHLNGSLDSPSNKRYLLSFYELDNPTKEEINIVKNQDKVFFSSNYTVDIFKMFGCSNVEFLPLAFDKYNFKRLEKKYFSDNRIVFNLVGKLEKRKNHKNVIQAWVKKFGNDSRYHLQCSIYNPFLKEEDNKALINSILEGKQYFNISFIGNMPKNAMYNDYLNSADIIIGMSGGEGWGLPEFHSLALGKHGVILNAHAYKDWATKDNSVLVESNGLIDSEDGVFFTKGAPFNQGNIFDFNEEAFIDGCEKAIERVENNKVNENGLKLQKEFTYKKTLESILKFLN